MSTGANDCPAAHSMDTTWFAVDADGNIGVFDSGEAGAVPTLAALGVNPGAGRIDVFPLDALRAAHVLARGQDEILDAGLDESVLEGERVVAVIDRAKLADSDTYRSAAKLGPFESALGDGLWILREESPRIVASRAPIDAAAHRALLSDASVVASLADGNIHEWLLTKKDTGVFVWANEDYEAAGLYVRSHETSAPLALDTLPSPLRNDVARLRFGHERFASATSIQLADHVAPNDVVLWGGATLRPPTNQERADAEQERQAAAIRREHGERTVRMVAVGILVLLVLAVLFGWLTR